MIFYRCLAGSVTLLAVGGGLRPLPLCSVVPYPPVRDTAVTLVLGRARPDTLPAGPGSVRQGVGPAHYSRAGQQVHAQLITVDQVAGSQADTLEAHFARSRTRIIAVVPWDYDPACQPVPWAREGPWAQPDSVGAYRLLLRARAEWAGGFPTFDAYRADLEPYPHGLYFRHGFRGSDSAGSGNGLSAAEFFDFYQALPAVWINDPHGSDALSPFRRWLAEHPALRQKYPVGRVASLWHITP